MKTPRVYFFVSPERDNYQNDAIQLAEGLRELGVEFHGHADYWQQSPDPQDFLFRKSEGIAPEDCDVVVVPYRWFSWRSMTGGSERRLPMPDCIRVPRDRRRYRTVYLDDNDGYATPALDPDFLNFDLVLRTKLNRRTVNPPNFRPWAIGLENRVLRATENPPPFAERRRAIYVNYNASHRFLHTSRQRALEQLHPRLGKILPTWQPPFADLDTPPADAQARLWWEQTNKRHSPVYYERLKSCQACSAFCGEVLPSMPPSPKIFEIYGRKAELQKTFWRMLGRLDPRPERIISWDSFRFWETLAAGAVAFHLDLDRYGVQLPVMPENWKHYIGVDFDRVDEAVERIQADPGCLELIAAAGHAWALQHYSPKAVAKRFLESIGSPLT